MKTQEELCKLAIKAIARTSTLEFGSESRYAYWAQELAKAALHGAESVVMECLKEIEEQPSGK